MKREYISPEFDYRNIVMIRDVLTKSHPEGEIGTGGQVETPGDSGGEW